MKILRALVGYLAVTFYPFAFASSLPVAAINNDGFVDTTQNPVDGALMKHVQVLSSVLETCKTLPVTYHSGDYMNTTTPNHSDSGALLKRVPSDIEKRWSELAPPVLIVIAIVIGITLSIVWIESDDPKRVAFTQNTISAMMSHYPSFNWVICHSSYSVGFDGVEGTDWGYTHHELKISWGRTVGFDLFWAKSGTFYRYGDGGFLNWAYNGNIIGTDNGGATVHFGTRS